MKTSKKVFKINSNGDLVQSNNNGSFEIVSRIWSWKDITKGHVRESRANHKASQLS